MDERGKHAHVAVFDNGFEFTGSIGESQVIDKLRQIVTREELIYIPRQFQSLQPGVGFELAGAEIEFARRESTRLKKNGKGAGYRELTGQSQQQHFHQGVEVGMP